MSSRIRTVAKRILPAPLHGGFFKDVWERFKLARDASVLRQSYPDVPSIRISSAAIERSRGQGYSGQICQDMFLERLFPQPAGRFIDIGANNPEANSNTYYFERKGWTGYAFDPMRSLKDRWTVRSGTQFINAGISDKRETRNFVEILPKVGWEHQLSSFREFVRDEDMREYDFLEYTVECSPISDFIAASEPVDFASIDVEGAEGLILRGFDFESNPPTAIMLENVSKIGGEDAHRDFLANNGYKFIARLHASDDLFVRADFAVPAEFTALVKAHLE